MKILFDPGTPVPLRNFLRDHEVITAFERGWQTLKNGDLLSTADDHRLAPDQATHRLRRKDSGGIGKWGVHRVAVPAGVRPESRSRRAGFGFRPPQSERPYLLSSRAAR